MPHQDRPIPSQSGHHLAEITPILLGCARIGRRMPVPAQIECHRTAVRHQRRRHLRPCHTVVAASVHQQHPCALAAEVHPREHTTGYTHLDLGPQHKSDTVPAADTTRNCLSVQGLISAHPGAGPRRPRSPDSSPAATPTPGIRSRCGSSPSPSALLPPTWSSTRCGRCAGLPRPARPTIAIAPAAVSLAILSAAQRRAGRELGSASPTCRTAGPRYAAVLRSCIRSIGSAPALLPDGFRDAGHTRVVLSSGLMSIHLCIQPDPATSRTRSGRRKQVHR